MAHLHERFTSEKHADVPVRDVSLRFKVIPNEPARRIQTSSSRRNKNHQSIDPTAHRARPMAFLTRKILRTPGACDGEDPTDS